MHLKIKTTGLLLISLSLVFALTATSGCEYPEFDEPENSRATLEITFTTARIERTSEEDNVLEDEIGTTEKIGSDLSEEEKILVPGIGRVVNVRTYVNIRAGAGLDQKIIGKARNSTEFSVTASFYTEKWHQILYEDETAFIYADYFDVQRDPYMADLNNDDLADDSDPSANTDAADVDQSTETSIDPDAESETNEDDDFSDEQGVG